jgi:hypothetical protein
MFLQSTNHNYLQIRNKQIHHQNPHRIALYCQENKGNEKNKNRTKKKKKTLNFQYYYKMLNSLYSHFDQFYSFFLQNLKNIQPGIFFSLAFSATKQIETLGGGGEQNSKREEFE